MRQGHNPLAPISKNLDGESSENGALLSHETPRRRLDFDAKSDEERIAENINEIERELAKMQTGQTVLHYAAKIPSPALRNRLASLPLGGHLYSIFKRFFAHRISLYGYALEDARKYGRIWLVEARS